MRAAERRKFERDRLRRKRLDAAYLARDLGRNASRMGSIRRRRRAAGQCGDCDAIAVRGRYYCAFHAAAHRRQHRK